MTAVQDPLRRLSPVVRLAPAKLNLTLAVVGRREDGYHSLHSVFVPLTLADRLSLAPLGGDRRHAPRHRARRRARRTTTWSSARWRRREPRSVAAGRAVPARHRPSRRGSTSGSRSRPDWPAARRTPRPPSTGRSRRGAPSWTSTPATLVAAHLGSDVPFFLAGGPALVEGRGEHVAPLHGLHGAPGVVLVTPLIAVSTPDVFAAFDAIRTHGDGAVRMSSTHLAEELRSGLTADNLVARAGVLASANDLLPATSLVVPALVPFKRALSRLLGPPDRTVGLRADALGALSFGDRRRGRRRRHPRGPGRRPPRPAGLGRSVRRRQRHRQPQPGGKRSHDPSRRLHRGCARRHRSVQPGHRRRRLPVQRGPGRARSADGGPRPGRHRTRDRAGHGQPVRASSMRRGRRGATWSRRRSSSSIWPTSRSSTASTVGS